MLDLTIVGPVAVLFCLADIALHIHLDLEKGRKTNGTPVRPVQTPVDSAALVLAAGATLLCFASLLIIISAWIISMPAIIPLLLVQIVDVDLHIWFTGLLLLCIGIVLHGWSRLVRREMASSWEMRVDHRIVKDGPYSLVRHPSYTSYMLSFVGLFLLIPSVITLIALVGIPGYTRTAIREEKHLVDHFEDEYLEYIESTGRFFPKLRRRV